MNYSATSDRVSEKALLADVLLLPIHVFMLALDVFANNLFIGVAYRYYDVTLSPQLSLPRILPFDLWTELEKFSS